MSRLRIVLAFDSLAAYVDGGGHWSAFLQYLFGLRALGHDVYWLEQLTSAEPDSHDPPVVHTFLRRFRHYGFGDRTALLRFDKALPERERTLAAGRAYGMSVDRIREIARSADLLLNFCCALRQPLLDLFRRRVLIDLDPGIVQISALTYDLDLRAHQVLFTMGRKLHDPDCGVPTLGLRWQPLTPIVHLPMWPPRPDPGPQAPFTSLTHWNWGELWMDGRVLSTSKRDAYIRYADLPRRATRSCELATIIYPDDGSGDHDAMRDGGWAVVHPYRVARFPSSYRAYIRRSRAEIACPKPIYQQLRTGWFSDRSACYLATGRPVLAEDTGFSEHLPTGRGLIAFRDLSTALAGIDEIDGNYAKHGRAARELAEEYFDSRRSLAATLCRCG
jgi:hypothetical protein